MSKPVIVGVSGINAIDNPGPGVGVARSLKEAKDLDVEIVGLAYDAMEPGIYLDWLVDKSYVMPYPSVGWDALSQRLAYIKETHGLDVVIPNLDTELPLYTKYADKIEAMGIKLFVPTYAQFQLRSKEKLAEVAEGMGIECPRTLVAASYDQFYKAVESMGYPCMVKGAFYKAYRANTPAEASHYFNVIVAEWGYPVLVQQIVAGDEVNAVGVGDGEGGLMGMVAAKKLMVTHLGKIWTGVSIRNEALIEAAERFVKKTKWRGPFEIECIADGDKLYLIEINPRFPAWSYFATGLGVNLPAAMLRKTLGRGGGAEPGYDAGKLFIRYTYETVTDMKAFQDLATKGETA